MPFNESDTFNPMLSRRALFQTAATIGVASLIPTPLFTPQSGEAQREAGYSPEVLKALISIIRFYPETAVTITGQETEPVDMAFIGDESRIKLAFQKAGWKIPDEWDIEHPERFARTLAKAWEAYTLGISYPTQPVSPYFYHIPGHGIIPITFAEEQQVNNNPGTRHHIRLFKVPSTVQGKSLILAIASYDRRYTQCRTAGIRDLPTHEIDPNLQGEVAYITGALLNTNMIKTNLTLTHVRPPRSSNNACGSAYNFNGNIQLIEI